MGNTIRPTCENGRILLLFFDDLPKPLRQIHCHHCITVLIPDERSERMKGKHDETMTKIEKRKRTKPTCGRPLQRDGSGLLSLRISNQYQHRNYRYILRFNTVVMNVLTWDSVRYWCCGGWTWLGRDGGERVMRTTEKSDRPPTNGAWCSPLTGQMVVMSH